MIAPVTTSQIQKCRNICKAFHDHPAVKERKKWNIDRLAGPATGPIGLSEFWQKYVTAVATTMTRSRKDGNPIEKLLYQPERYDALDWDKVEASGDPEKLISRSYQLANNDATYGAIYAMWEKARQLEKGYRRLQDGEWDTLSPHISFLKEKRRNRDEERQAARAFTRLPGLGPKQARNVLQMLGLLRYETPLDSRVSRFLCDELDLKVTITSALLGNHRFYEQVLDWVQLLCRRADVYPTIFDICAFLYEKDPEDIPPSCRRVPTCRITSGRRRE